MKKFTPILLFVSFVIALTGCLAQQTVPSPSPSLQTPATTAPAESGTPDTAPSGSPALQKAYFGAFNITEEVASGVSTYSQADIDNMIGTTLRFSSDKAVIINDQPSDSPVEIKNPQYSESVLTVDDFLSAYRVSAEKLGISSGDITEIVISDPSGAVGGCTLLMQGDQVFITAGGVFFALERIS